jgi:hypothetical protein
VEAICDARGAIEQVVASAGDGRTSAERLRDLADTLRAVTSRLGSVGADADAAAAAPAYS